MGRPVENAGEQRVARGDKAEFLVMLGCAAAAALAIKAPMLFGLEFDGDGGSFYARNLSLFVLPFLAIYFIWTRGLSRKGIAGLAAVFVAGAVFANAYPFTPGGSTEILTAIHLPIVLWLTLGVAYVSGDWLTDARRMEYVRFTGEWFITYALIALGGGVLVGITFGVFQAIGLDVSSVYGEWVLPCGAMGAVIVAAWLVGSPPQPRGWAGSDVGARVHPAVRGHARRFARRCRFDSRRHQRRARGAHPLRPAPGRGACAAALRHLGARPTHRAGALRLDTARACVCALAVDVFALLNIAARLTEYGFSANKTAALGLNLILLVNLAWSARLQTGFLRSRRGFEAVERWQMRYLPVYALWAAIVVVVFPPLFGFV